VIASGHTVLIESGSPFPSVAHDHAHVSNTTVLQLGEDLQPVFRTLATIAGPQPEDVPVAVHRHRQGDVDGSVRDLPVPHFHRDTVDEDRRIHRIQRPVLPLGHALDHPVGDRGDRRFRHLSPIHFDQVSTDITMGEAAGRQRQDHLVDPGQAPLVLAHNLRLEGPVPVPRDLDRHLAHISQDRFRPRATARVRHRLRPLVPVIAEVIGDLTLKR
jgi:hypothetical protein